MVNLDNAIARAQVLMSEEYQKKMDGMTVSSSKKKKKDNTFSGLEQQLFGYSDNTVQYSQQPLQEQMRNDNISSSTKGLGNLPDFLKESVKNTPLGGVADTGYNYAPQQMITASNTSMGQIDYNYIKYLMESVIKENTNKLNESANVTTFRGMRIAEGNKFQFIDSKGNVYEGVLTLKKRAQNK